MATSNFYLRKTTGKNHPIEYVFQYSGHRIRVGIGVSIDPDIWNSSKQQAAETELTTKNGTTLLNGYLSAIIEHTKNGYATLLKSGKPNPETVKKHILDFIRPQPIHEHQSKETLFELIERFINNEITYKGRQKAEATIKTYKTTKLHLKEFEKANKYPIDFDSITISFYHKFTSYLRKKNKSDNTIGKYIQVIKVFMKTAVELKLTNNLDFQKDTFAVLRVETDAVHLNEREIIHFYNYDLSANPRLERVRDLFVFGCYVGLRFQDYSKIRPENIVSINDNLKIKFKTQKTEEVVIIPCHPIVKHIFEKYKGITSNNLPESISNQKFNDYIKIAAQLAGFTETGRLLKNMNLQLFECISSHTCRRSFATNYYGKVPTKTLMQITGHRSEKTFLKYIKTSKIESADILQDVMETEYSKNVLKVINF